MAGYVLVAMVTIFLVSGKYVRADENVEEVAKDSSGLETKCINDTCSDGNRTGANNTGSSLTPVTPVTPVAPVTRKPRLNKPSPRHPYDREGRYWLVPPFLIGASSVIVVYIFMHCVYLHCYTKKKIRQIARKLPQTPAIILSDGDQLSQSSFSGLPPGLTSGMAPITPIVRYDGSYGKTELVETQPFLIYQPADVIQEEGHEVKEKVRRKSSIMQHLQLPNMFRRPSRQRPSVCSTGAVMETSGTGADIRPDDAHAGRRRSTRASICFVPVGRTISDPSGTKSEWTPLQGFVYSSVLFARNASYSMACGVPNCDPRDSREGIPSTAASHTSVRSHSAGEPQEDDVTRLSGDASRPMSQDGIVIEVPPLRDPVVKFEISDEEDTVFMED